MSDVEDEDDGGGPVTNAWNKKVPPFTKEDNPHGLVEESSFTLRFPGYREVYLKSVWPLVTKALAAHSVNAELDLVQGSVTVVTTRKTWDPFIIIKARDLIQLLARSMPFEKAVMVLNDDVFADIIKIDGLVGSQDRFVKRRLRLMGPDDTTLEALQLLTGCTIHVQGGTVAVIGSHRGLRQVRKVVVETMNNRHPVMNIKALMVKRQLESDETMKGEDWNRFLPAYANKRTSGRKKPKLKKKKEYTPFPPPQLERKIDKDMATGEHFLAASQKRSHKIAERTVKNAASKEKQVKKRAKPFEAPVEPEPTSASTSVKRKKSSIDDTIDVEALKKKIKKSQSKKRKVE